jgi:hypothetical protein
MIDTHLMDDVRLEYEQYGRERLTLKEKLRIIFTKL